MRILVVQESDWIRRNPVQQHHMLERLSRDGHDVLVIDYPILWREDGHGLTSPRRVYHDVSKVTPDSSITVVRTAMVRLPVLGKLTWLATNVVEISRAFRAFRPDVLIVLGLSNSLIAMKIAQVRGVPVVVHLIDALHTLVEPKDLRPVAAWVERAVLRGSDRVVVINETLAEYARHMGADAHRIQVIPTGADTERFGPHVDGSRVRVEYGIGPRDVVMLFVGWLYTFSGLREVAEEMAAHPEDAYLKLLVVGDGDLMGELKRLKDGTLGERLVLAGPQPVARMPEFMAAADVCILPAHANETMTHIVPAKMYEYLAAGKPVCASPLPSLITEFGYGSGVEYVNGAEALLQAVRDLSNNRSEVKARGAEARQTALSVGNWDVVTDRFRRALSSVMRAECVQEGYS